LTRALLYAGAGLGIADRVAAWPYATGSHWGVARENPALTVFHRPEAVAESRTAPWPPEAPTFTRLGDRGLGGGADARSSVGRGSTPAGGPRGDATSVN